MTSETPTTSALPTVTITTDGATRGNPGPGGWAALLEYGAHARLIDGAEPAQTTSSVMELVAVAAALEALTRPCHVVLRCDSTYVLNGLAQALASRHLPQKNRAVWERLHAAAARHQVELVWVKGHAGDARNERVDRAANAAANRAYAASAALRDAPAGADAWILALCSGTASRAAGWALHTPHGRVRGTIGTPGVMQPATMYHALIAGLQAAAALPGAASATLHVVSNWELIIKQQRGEWAVKQAAHQPLHREALALRAAFQHVAFACEATETVLGYFVED